LNGGDEDATGPKGTRDLCKPDILDMLRKMREDRVGIDNIKSVIVERELTVRLNQPEIAGHT
jgi:hypothetical protein